ncbi:MAG: translesion error-prone DNA polymerase V autoproteolytic subunit [candidate division Zixibacteria bacterium]|nr:translesion error-prone DNA polymerase V autoproteolytic subunit [candidate division Zixibacteria bacterium]
MAKATVLSKVPFEDRLSSKYVPLFTGRVAAGFPSPADDYLEGPLDLNKHLIQHPAATFFVRVTGDSMIGAGIHSGDMLIVDRALEPADNKVIIAVVNGELTVKRLCKRNNQLVLMPENDNCKPIPIEDETDFEVWGVVTVVIHSL